MAFLDESMMQSGRSLDGNSFVDVNIEIALILWISACYRYGSDNVGRASSLDCHRERRDNWRRNFLFLINVVH